MTSPVSIALSGLTAASTRANAAASNIAGAGVTGSRDTSSETQPYTPVDVVQTTPGAESGQQGTRADTVARDPASVPAYEPDAPYADADGYVAAPNVDFARELIDLKQAALAYKANAAVVRVADDMQREMLDRFDETV